MEIKPVNAGIAIFEARNQGIADADAARIGILAGTLPNPLMSWVVGRAMAVRERPVAPAPAPRPTTAETPATVTGAAAEESAAGTTTGTADTRSPTASATNGVHLPSIDPATLDRMAAEMNLAAEEIRKAFQAHVDDTNRKADAAAAAALEARDAALDVREIARSIKEMLDHPRSGYVSTALPADVPVETRRRTAK